MLLWVNRSCVYSLKGDRAQALKDISEAIRLAPQMGPLYRVRAGYWGPGEQARVKEDLAKAQELGTTPFFMFNGERGEGITLTIAEEPSLPPPPLPPSSESKPTAVAPPPPPPETTAVAPAQASAPQPIINRNPAPPANKQQTTAPQDKKDAPKQPAILNLLGDPAKLLDNLTTPSTDGADATPPPPPLPTTPPAPPPRLFPPPPDSRAVELVRQGRIHAGEKEYDKAMADFDEAVRLDPTYTEAYIFRGAFRSRYRKEHAKARADFQEALRLEPDNSQANNDLAWFLATCPEAKYRDGKRAVTYAKRAVELTKRNFGMMDTLAAAHAEAGEFEQAVQWQEKAAPGFSNDEGFQQRLDLYRKGRAYREE